jgi:hypothetical protein
MTDKKKRKLPQLKYYELLSFPDKKMLCPPFYNIAEVRAKMKELKKKGIKCRAYDSEGYWVV